MDEVYASLPIGPSGEVRLIDIEPGKETDPIVVHMRCVSLDDPELRYEGLSYTWGDYSKPQTITCNGAQFNATYNLNSALRRLRENGRRTFWVDAICINQKDLIERADQVKQMRRIYSQAKPVWIDLGETNPRVSELFALMKKLDDVLSSFENEDTNTTPINPYKFEDYGLPPYHDNSWYMWQELLSRPYFRRTWIIQEFTVSRETYVLLGNKFFMWYVFYYYTMRMRNHGISEDVRPMHPDAPSTVRVDAILGHNSIKNLYQAHSTYQAGIPLKLHLLLEEARNADASDPKDKVFGVLGIAGDVDISDPEFEIKYDMNETVAQLYTRTCRGMIRQGRFRALQCLLDGGTQLNERLPGLPSWVPDWNSRRAGITLGGLSNVSYHAADGLDFKVAVEGDVMRVRGRILDRIADLSSAYKPDASKDHSEVYYGIAVAKWLREAFDIALKTWPNILGDASGEHEEMKEALWRTLICNKTHTDVAATESYSANFESLLIRQRYIDVALIGHDDDEHLEPIDSEEYSSADSHCLLYRLALQNSMYTKSFCITAEKKFMGMVPGAAQIGDHIVLVAGSPVPFVMRAVDGLNSKWILVQECYIHGFMGGEYAQGDDVWQDMAIV